MDAGYEFGGTQGWVYANPQPGARTIKLFVDPTGRDFMTVASPEGEADAAVKGYRFVRIEGYAPAAP